MLPGLAIGGAGTISSSDLSRTCPSRIKRVKRSVKAEQQEGKENETRLRVRGRRLVPRLRPRTLYWKGRPASNRSPDCTLLGVPPTLLTTMRHLRFITVPSS